MFLVFCISLWEENLSSQATGGAGTAAPNSKATALTGDIIIKKQASVTFPGSVSDTNLLLSGDDKHDQGKLRDPGPSKH